MMNRVAVVTGAGQGIGRQIALTLARRGYRVAATDLNGDGAQETAGLIAALEGAPAGIGVTMDVADSDSVQQGLLAVVDELGPVEVLVNNAGWDDFMPFLQTDEALWDKIIDINYKGALRTTHACLPSMIESNFGRIINIGSDAGRVGSSLEAVYSGAKGAVIAFTKTVAREVATKGITANTVCPGPTDTALLAQLGEGESGAKVLGGLARSVPMKRIGQPSDIATAVAFFASDDASFITGQTLSVSGGLTMAG